MGKKGKRSKRKAVTAADRASVAAVQTKIQETIEKFQESNGLNLRSQAADELREIIQLIDANMREMGDTLLRMNILTSFVKSKLIFYSDLMSIELSRRNFDDAIQIYENLFQKGNIKMKMEILSDIFPSLQLQYHEALLRQGKGSVDTFITLSNSFISHGIEEDLEIDLIRSADILRITKHFDAAIVLGKQLEVLTGDRLSLVATYLEQYIVDDKESLPEDFFLKKTQVMKKHKIGRFTTYHAVSTLVLAQITYLFHQFFDDTEEVLRKSIGFIEEYLDLISDVQSYCITCTQTATESEVQFVCSGCRVACYCSIDHQRMTWKKEAEKGMRFGHEVLCPVMKAYRKWRHANDNGENEQVSRLRRRFERECLYCLSDGLGLKDKCIKKK